MVVKPNTGRQGRDIHAGVTSARVFTRAFCAVETKYPHVMVEEFVPGVEHRCLVVDRKLVAVTRRRPASVVVDVEATSADLVTAKNHDRGRIQKPLRLDDRAEAFSPEEATLPTPSRAKANESIWSSRRTPVRQDEVRHHR
ncbi:hypothetical protein [uncultured Serinicoccus sp.]|uniref:hypothetical protein n=1 Tax=uncultured Serinicoccus sp. TaxID=735514 RepID=UPI0026364E44|nr:hypothetical protein [uncultured Serinicoccus sp.]